MMYNVHKPVWFLPLYDVFFDYLLMFLLQYADIITTNSSTGKKDSSPVSLDDVVFLSL